MIVKPLVHGLTPQQQPRCQPVKYFTYCSVIGFFNNCKIITLSHKDTTSKVHQVPLDRIGEKMALLVQFGKYGAIKTTENQQWESM